MVSPTMMAKVNELTKNSSVSASLLIAEQKEIFGLHLLVINTRYDSGMMYKEIRKFEDKDTYEAAALAALSVIEVYEECQLLTVTL